MKNRLEGVFAVTTTPMFEDGTVDIEGFKDNIDWYIESGLPGVCILGSTGEFSSLTKEELIDTSREIVNHIDGRIKCIVGTAAETTEDTVMYTKNAEEIGADGVLIINPYYCLPNEEELIEHYKYVSDHTDIPIMVYNNPAHTGVDMTPELIIELNKIKNVDYVKDASGDLVRVSEILRRTDGEMTVFCGSENQSFENFILGAKGWISVSADVFPVEMNRMYNLIQEGNLEEAEIIFKEIYPLLYNLENGGKPLQQVKYILDKMGKAGGVVRRPRLPLNQEEKERLDMILEDIF